MYVYIYAYVYIYRHTYICIHICSTYVYVLYGSHVVLVVVQGGGLGDQGGRYYPLYTCFYSAHPNDFGIRKDLTSVVVVVLLVQGGGLGAQRGMHYPLTLCRLHFIVHTQITLVSERKNSLEW
jgi:hypothetical protein